MMGPIDLTWYTDRDIQVTNGCPEQTYYGGRIDIRGSFIAAVYSVPIMKGRDWGALTMFLKGYTTEELVSYEEIISTFEEQIGRKIEWWED